MTGSFDPVSGRPTGSASTEPSRRGTSLPTGSTPGKRPARTARRDKRDSKGGGGTWLVVVGLVVGLGLIGVALIPHGTNGSEAAAAPTTTTETTAATPTTTTTSTTTTTTTTKAPAGQWQAVPVRGNLEYEVPPDWTLVPQVAITYGSSEYADYSVLRYGATYTTTACTTWPVAAGIYLDESAGPSAAQASKYAKGLATVAFGRPFGDIPTMTVTSSRHLDGDGWLGREIVVHVVPTTADCDLSAGVVVLLALSTDDQPGRTVMIAAYSGTDSPDGPQGADEATLRKIVESVSVAS
ncbi:hypothetical protein [Labedaea rhizosphaerae]|uniref:DUF8017 domain-containing protein n=1 Tax=Labedaea rhizosphaerae TaxID=598644 RepID=A0A4R6SE45_LABRH|nr:hypothetical protein [Labedaea rhizosphaerae]TDP97316.1 hypothetical protein EV186_103280 [Labedaea rhizosphaerae]